MTEDFPTTCTPLPKGTPSLDAERAARWAAEIPSWTLRGAELRLERRLPHFQAALDWIAAVGAIAEAHDHHPDIHLTGWNRVELVLSTHSIGGLSANDFVVARAIDALAQSA
jgi:4a-hydroxytetrahydrobiopterin dehydratase